MAGGVVEGFAQYFGIDPTWSRIGTVVASALSIGVAPAYVAAWLLIPDERDPDPRVFRINTQLDRLVPGGLAFALALGMLSSGANLPDSGSLVSLVLIGLGLMVLKQASDSAPTLSQTPTNGVAVKPAAPTSDVSDIEPPPAPVVNGVAVEPAAPTSDVSDVETPPPPAPQPGTELVHPQEVDLVPAPAPAFTGDDEFVLASYEAAPAWAQPPETALSLKTAPPPVTGKARRFGRGRSQSNRPPSGRRGALGPAVGVIFLLAVAAAASDMDLGSVPRPVLIAAGVTLALTSALIFRATRIRTVLFGLVTFSSFALVALA